MKIAYKILNTPKELRQDNKTVVSDKKRKAWFQDSLMSQ